MSFQMVKEQKIAEQKQKVDNANKALSQQLKKLKDRRVDMQIVLYKELKKQTEAAQSQNASFVTPMNSSQQTQLFSPFKKPQSNKEFGSMSSLGSTEDLAASSFFNDVPLKRTKSR